MYCTVEDIINRASNNEELQRLTRDGNMTQKQIITECIQAATDEIDLYIEVEQPVSGAVRNICVDLAIYQLFCRVNGSAPQIIAWNVERADKKLKLMSQKKLLPESADSKHYTTPIQRVRKVVEYQDVEY